MMDFSKIDSFINDLKEMHSIAELDRHLLHLLLEMKSDKDEKEPTVSETTQKFLQYAQADRAVFVYRC